MKKYLLPLFLFLSLNTYSQISIISSGDTYTENFDGMGSTFKASIPSGFRIGADWSTALTQTDTSAGTTGSPNVLSSTSRGYCYNFANGVNSSATDRCLGFLNSNSYPSSKNIILKITNNTGCSLTVRYSGADVKMIEIPNGGTRRVNLSSGTYKVAASACGENYAGTESLQGSYSSSFYIETRRY